MATARQARRAAELHADELSAYPNVVGVGTRPLGSQPSGDDDPHAVAVYVSEEVAADDLADHARLPAHVEIHEAGETIWVPVVVVTTGTFEPEAGQRTTPQDPGFTTD